MPGRDQPVYERVGQILIKKEVHDNRLRLRHHVRLPLPLSTREAVLGAASVDRRTVAPIKDYRCLNCLSGKFVIFRNLGNVPIRALELRHNHPDRHICRGDPCLIDAGLCEIEMDVVIKQHLLMA